MYSIISKYDASFSTVKRFNFHILADGNAYSSLAHIVCEKFDEGYTGVKVYDTRGRIGLYGYKWTKEEIEQDLVDTFGRK